jgi:phosphoglycerate dehydrogenase-like enzyme
MDVQAELDGFGTYRLKVGIIGASTTGRRVIELLRPFDLNVALSTRRCRRMRQRPLE